jgi:hypothetical protein
MKRIVAETDKEVEIFLGPSVLNFRGFGTTISGEAVKGAISLSHCRIFVAIPCGYGDFG